VTIDRRSLLRRTGGGTVALAGCAGQRNQPTETAPPATPRSRGEISATDGPTDRADGNGGEFVVWDDGDGTTQIARDRDRPIQYSGDLGEIVEQIQADHPEGAALKIANLVTYESPIHIHTSGFVVQGQVLRRRGAPLNSQRPYGGVGLYYDGPQAEPLLVAPKSGDVVQDVRLENLYLACNRAATCGVKFDGSTGKSIRRVAIDDVRIDGSGGHGFWVYDNVFGGWISSLVVQGAGLDGIRFGWGGSTPEQERNHRPGQWTIGRLVPRATNSRHGVVFNGVGAFNVDYIYNNRAGHTAEWDSPGDYDGPGHGVYFKQPPEQRNHFVNVGLVYAERNEADGIRFEGRAVDISIANARVHADYSNGHAFHFLPATDRRGRTHVPHNITIDALSTGPVHGGDGVRIEKAWNLDIGMTALRTWPPEHSGGFLNAIEAIDCQIDTEWQRTHAFERHSVTDGGPTDESDTPGKISVALDGYYTPNPGPGITFGRRSASVDRISFRRESVDATYRLPETDLIHGVVLETSEGAAVDFSLEP
jgi:hypothetical protein